MWHSALRVHAPLRGSKPFGVRKMLWCLVATVCMLLPLSAAGSSSANNKALIESRTKSARCLLDKGNRFFLVNNMDSARVYYHKLLKQYNTALSDAEREYCLNGIYGSFEVNMRHSDYMGAFEDLSLADEIVHNLELPDYKLNMYYSAFYVVLGSHTEKAKFYDRVIDYGRLAYRDALQAGDSETAYRAFGNMITASRQSKRIAQIQPDKKIMERYAARHHDFYPQLAVLMLNAAEASDNGRFTEAVAIYDSMLRVLPHIPATQRSLSAFMKDKAEFMIEAGDCANALKILDEAERLTYRLDIKDIRLAILSLRQRAYEKMNNVAEAERIAGHVNALYDSLQSYMVAYDLSQLEYMKERRYMQNTIRDNAWRAKVSTWAFAVSVFVVLVVIIFLLVLRSKNRRLRNHSNLLYERIQRLIADAEVEKKNAVSCSLNRPRRTESTVKYESSGLDDADKEEIADAIKRIMDSDAIYSADLSLSGFAEMAGRNSKAVSQVIHERYNCNFSTLINKARIMEFCRRMELSQYADYSTEGIAESVGFASRNTFDYNFKRFTGVGLRAYRKAAQEAKNQ